MANKDKNKEVDSVSELTNEEMLKEAMNTPLIADEVERQASEKAKIQAEETGKKLYLQDKIKDFDNERLSKELYNYRATNITGFNELISGRERIMQSKDDLSVAELKAYADKIEYARISEREFQNQKELDAQRSAEVKPSRDVDAGFPKDISEIEANENKYKQFKYNGFSNLYKTQEDHLAHEAHKKFKYHEKNDLCSIHNDDCAEFTRQCQNEFRQAEIRNKPFSKSVKILN